MSPKLRRRFIRFVIAASLTVAAVLAAGWLIGPLAGLAVAVLGFLATAVAADDRLGTCLPLAIFSLIGLTLLTLVFIAVIKVNS